MKWNVIIIVFLCVNEGFAEENNAFEFSDETSKPIPTISNPMDPINETTLSTDTQENLILSAVNENDRNMLNVSEIKQNNTIEQYKLEDPSGDAGNSSANPVLSKGQQRSFQKSDSTDYFLDAGALVCDKVGRFPFPNSCEKYYYCWDDRNSNAVFSCPYVFDPTTKQCIEDFSVCPSAPKCMTAKDTFEYPGDKTAFYDCTMNTNGKTAIYVVNKRKCDIGLEYKAEAGICVLSSRAGSLLDQSNMKHECRSSGLFIDYENDSRYYECLVMNVAKGTFRAISRECGENLTFNAMIQSCVPLVK